jgi:acetolactate synthase I/II/III large subunit
MISEYHGRLVGGLADRLVERLRAVGARALFGVPGGGGNLRLIEAAGRASLPFVLTTTETGGAIAAIAQSEVTGRPGACLTTLGPGVSSVVNGVACAFLERAPMFVFTDNYASAEIGTYDHQAFLHRTLLERVTKQSLSLAPDRAFGSIEQAFASIAEPPYGPVHLDCPADFESASVPKAYLVGSRRPDAVRPTEHARMESILERARKPLVIAGLGARADDDAAAIRRFCEQRELPAMVTYKAKGVVPDAHPCFAGVFTNGAIEREIIDQSDVIIGVGLDPVELLPRPWTIDQPIISVASWMMPNTHVPFSVQWVSDVPAGLAAIEAWLPPSGWDLRRIAPMVADQRRRVDIKGDGMTSSRVVDVAASALAATSRVTVDAGAHMFPATMGWSVAEPNGMLISNGLSTMGFALPAAIGAALVDRSRPVVALTGDGGLLMCAGELLTAAREKLRIIVIVFNDASLSLIEIKQQARRLPPAGVGLGAVRWTALAESVGVAGFEASTEAELEHAIERASACDGPSLIDAKIDRSTYGEMLRVIRG